MVIARYVRVAFVAKFITPQFEQPFIWRSMNSVAVIAIAVAQRFMNDLAGKILGAVARETQVRRFPDEELGVLALMRLVASIAHADLEGAVFLPAGELLGHMAVETKAWRGFGEQVFYLR